MIVFGAVVVCFLLRPIRPGDRQRLAELRAAASPQEVRALAEAKALADAVNLRTRPDARSSRRTRVIRGAIFGAVAVGLGATAHRVAEGAWPAFWSSAGGFASLVAVGYGMYASDRRRWLWVVVVAGSQLVLSAGFSAAAILTRPGGAGTADWARVLFCYHAGSAPTAAQVIAARNALGPGAASLLPVHPSAAGNLLVWSALAHFVAALLLAIYVTLTGHTTRGERLARWCQQRRRGRHVVTGADGRVPVGQSRGLATVVRRVEQGMRGPAGSQQLVPTGPTAQ